MKLLKDTEPDIPALRPGLGQKVDKKKGGI